MTITVSSGVTSSSLISGKIMLEPDLRLKGVHIGLRW
jgi:hypothetical protein